MTIDITTSDCVQLFADRDGVAAFYPRHLRQGFDVTFNVHGDVRIHFEDERDAVRVAKAILLRLGEDFQCPQATTSTSTER